MLTSINKQYKSKRHILLASLAGVGALAAGLTASIMTANRSDQDSADKLSELWAMTLQTPSGAPVPLSKFKSKPLLINFWATWCAPCIEEMPMLEQFHLSNVKNSNGMQLLGIAADKPESVVKFLNATPVTFPIALAGFEGVSLSQSLGNAKGGLPFSILIDKNSTILFKKEGQLTAEDFKIIQNKLTSS